MIPHVVLFRRTALRVPLRAAVFALLALLLGCGDSGGGDSGAATSTPAAALIAGSTEMNPFLPIANEMEWTYAGEDESTRSGGARLVSGVTVDSLLYPGGEREYYVTTEDAIYLSGFFVPEQSVPGAGTFAADILFTENILLWQQGQAPGVVQQVDGAGSVTITPGVGQQGISVTGTAQFVGVESVDVPYGEFDAVHVTYDLVATTLIEGVVVDFPFRVDAWFAEGVGIVLREEAPLALRLESVTGGDSDEDGVLDLVDAFPDDPNESRDTDGDGIGNNADTDDDGDGIPDDDDLYPLNVSTPTDFDGDGVENDADLDDDNDGVPDASDPFPLDPTRFSTIVVSPRSLAFDFVVGSSDPRQTIRVTGENLDWVAEASDSWIDVSPSGGTGDGNLRVEIDSSALPIGLYNGDIDVRIVDSDVAVRVAVSVQVRELPPPDFDRDGVPDAQDLDDDNDGLPDDQDPFPFDPTRSERLVVSPSPLAFDFVRGSRDPATTLRIRGENLDWTTQASDPWIDLSPSSGTGDQNVRVEVDASALAVGSYNGEITVRLIGADVEERVAVSVRVREPELILTGPPVSFDLSSSSGTINLTATITPAVRTYPLSAVLDFPESDVLELSVPGFVNENGATIGISLDDPSELSAGTYSGELTVTANVLGQALVQSVDVEVIVPSRRLLIPQRAIGFTEQGRDREDRREVLILESSGSESVNWVASSDQDWLEVETSSGRTGDFLELRARGDEAPQNTLSFATVTVRPTTAGVGGAVEIRAALYRGSGGLDDESELDTNNEYRYLATDPYRPYVYLNESNDSDIDVFHVHTEQRVTTLSNVVGRVVHMEVSQDARWLYVADTGSGGNRIVRIDLDRAFDGNASPISWSYPGSLEYGFTLFENQGKLFLASGQGRIFDAETGSEYTGSPIIGGGTDGVYLDAALYGDVLCGVDSVFGPMEIECWDLAYDVDEDRLETRSRGRSNSGTVGRDVAVSRDGSLAVVARASPDVFTVINTSNFSTVRQLEAEFFPVAVEMGPDDAIHGGAFVTDDDDRDFWVYDAGNYRRRTRETVSEDDEGIFARQIAVTADGRGTVILSGDSPPVVVRDY